LDPAPPDRDIEPPIPFDAVEEPLDTETEAPDNEVLLPATKDISPAESKLLGPVLSNREPVEDKEELPVMILMLPTPSAPEPTTTPAVADEVIHDVTPETDSDEFALSANAATPATCGEAIDVPEIVLVALFDVYQEEVMFEPGANTSTHDP
jgi:hypothetical protein